MTDKPRPPRPPQPNPFGDDPKPKPPKPGTNKFEARGKHPRALANERLEKVKLRLNDPDAIKRAQDRLPYEIAKLLARFQTNLGRRLLVKLLIEELTGEEVALPKDIMGEIDFLLEEDAKRTPDAKPIISVAQGARLYRLLSEELRGRGDRS